MERYNVIVAGAGISGLLSALSVAKSIIEGHPVAGHEVLPLALNKGDIVLVIPTFRILLGL